MSDTPLVPSAVYGLRTWRAVGGPAGERLAGPHSGIVWPDAGGWLTATCARAAHAAPGADCSCGIHAWHPRRRSARTVLASRWEVPGIVEAEGAIEVHDDGFRAERARPYALVLAPRRDAALVGRLAEAHAVPVLEVARPDDLVAWCDGRGLGLDEATVGALIGQPDPRDRRRARRRRTRTKALRLAAAIVVAAVLVVAGSEAFDPPGDRVLRGRAGDVHVR